MQEEPNNNDSVFTGEIVDPVVPQPSRRSGQEQRALFESHENKAFHIIKITLISIFGLYIIILSAVVLFHLLASTEYRWLSPQEVASLEKMFVTGIGAALLGKFGNKLADFR